MSAFARRLMFAAALTFGTAGFAFAQPIPDSAEEAMGEDVHDGKPTHHEQLSLKEIFGGEHSWEFWGAVVNFAVLLFILGRMGGKPLADYLEQRRNGVEEGMKEAAEIKAKAEAMYNEYQERLKTMDTDMAKLRKDIQEAAEADKKRILAEAEQSAARLRKDTEALIEQQSRELSESIRAEVVTASIAAAEEVIKKALESGDQERLAQQFKQELGQIGGRA